MVRDEFETFLKTLEKIINFRDAKFEAGSPEQQTIHQAKVVQKIIEDLLPDIDDFDRDYETHKNTNDEVNEHRAKIETLRQQIQASADERARIQRDERQFEEIVNEHREKLESAPETERDALTELLDRAQADLSNCRQTINDLNAAISEAKTGGAAVQAELDAAEARLQAQEQRYKTAHEKFAGKIQGLMNSLNELSEKIIRDIFPSDGARFLVENKSKLPLQEPDELLEKIRDLKRAPEKPESNDTSLFFRLNCKSLEEELQSLVDHLTAKRVAEEMDGQTYVNQLRGNFGRISRNAETAIKTLSEEQEKTQRAEEHLQDFRSFADTVRQEFSGSVEQLKAEADIPEDSGKNKHRNVEPQEIVDLCKNGASFCEQLGGFLQKSEGNLKSLQNDFCSAPNQDAAEQQSRLVSQAIERSPLLRLYPMFVAAAFTILVKGILARNNAELLHDNSITILVISFVASWAFSIWVGFSSRRKKMTSLRTHTARQIRHIITPHRSDPQITNLTLKTVKRLVSWIKRSVAKSFQMLLDRRLMDEAVKFPSIEYGANSAGNKDQSVFQWRNENFQRTAIVVALNFAVLAIPSAVFFGWDRILGNTVSDDMEHRLFVARLPEAPPCVLARGRLVFATKADYFIRDLAPSAISRAGWIQQIFPEIGAQVVPRDLVIRVIPTNHADDDHGLLDCTATDPNHNTLRIHHAGKVLDALGEEEVHQEIFSGLQKIAENLSGASTAVWSPETDPEIAEARDEMEELLAVTDPIEFDGLRFVAAFGRIQQSLAEKLVIAEKLSIADTMRLTWPRTNSLTPSTKFPNPLQVDLLDQDELEALTDLVARIAASNEKLAQLIEQEIPLGNSPAAVVLPILHELQENTPSSEVQPSTWITNLLLPNGAPAGKGWPDTLILPFFNDEVKFTEPKDIKAYDDNPLKMAFVFGARKSNFKDPALGSEKEGTYFSRIAKHLGQCLKSNGDRNLGSDDAELTLDIIGLASRTWKDKNPTHSKEQLNLALAEGRRAVTLLKLIDAISDKEVQNRIHIMSSNSPTDTLSLAQISDMLTGEPEDWFDRRLEFDRFSTHEEHAKTRSNFITPSASRGDDRLPLEELFARSVVVKVERVRGGPCADI
ncbi:hypothetical protein [Ruegeria meonggei]|uniref:hypothetical protein n=1 Tax=Ruegeria meonggei TaxID=1446476 RepID=UPI00366FD558